MLLGSGDPGEFCRFPYKILFISLVDPVVQRSRPRWPELLASSLVEIIVHGLVRRWPKSLNKKPGKLVNALYTILRIKHG